MLAQLVSPAAAADYFANEKPGFWPGPIRKYDKRDETQAF
jgi:hypothetical protein